MAHDGTTPVTPPNRWVCACCGKTSPTRYGFDENNKNVADPGWDESCMLNAVLCRPATANEHKLTGAMWWGIDPHG